MLRDCDLVGRMLDGRRAPARRRLEREIGEQFARRLVQSLCRRAQLDNGV